MDKLQNTKKLLFGADLFNLKTSHERMKEIEDRLVCCQQGDPSKENLFCLK